MSESRVRPADGDQADRLHIFAHDIKNRLGGLWEALRLLHSGPQAEVDPEVIMAFAERGFFQAQRDLEDLLDDFGVERGIAADLSTFNLLDSLNEALRNEDYRLKKKAQQVELIAPGAALATGDPRMTTQLLQALISNASKFSPHGTLITIEVSSGNDGHTVHVKDRGCGLSGSDLKDLFTRYAILSSRSTDGEPQSRGTLARARQWAEAQGGSLVAASEGIGKGCILTLHLPGA